VIKSRNIVACQKADDLVVRIYELTEVFPKSEIYGLTSQIHPLLQCSLMLIVG